MKRPARLRPVLILTTSLLAVAATAQADCRFLDEREASLAADGHDQLLVHARAGDLEIVGRDTLDSVEVRGRVCASSQKLLDEIQLISEAGADGLEVRVEIPDVDWGWRTYAYVDLVIEAPSRLALDVHDSSGDVDLQSVASASIHDSSGDLGIRDIRGDLEIHDSSGDIRAVDVTGTVWVEDSSGDIDVRDSGALTVERDSSGDIEATDIAGSVLVQVDSSGDIEVRQVGGDFTVGRDGSGSVDYRDVEGRVSVPSDD